MEADGQVRADDGYRVRQSRLRTPRGGIRDSRFSRGTSVRIEFGSLRGAGGGLTNRGRHPGRLWRQPVHWPRHLTFGSQSARRDRKSTRLNSSHSSISYAVFCLKKKKKKK